MSEIEFNTLQDRNENTLLCAEYSNIDNHVSMGIAPVFRIDDIVVYSTDTTIFVFDVYMEQISTAIGFKISNHPLLGDCIIDVRVWDNVVSHEPGLLHRILFEYVLPTYGVIVCDSVDVWYCKRFWLNRAPESFDNGTFLYLLDTDNHTLARILNLETWYAIYYKNKNRFWGESARYRIVIADKVL